MPAAFDVGRNLSAVILRMSIDTRDSLHEMPFDVPAEPRCAYLREYRCNRTTERQLLGSRHSAHRDKAHDR
jgi:hypothetical protein